MSQETMRADPVSPSKGGTTFTTCGGWLSTPPALVLYRETNRISGSEAVFIRGIRITRLPVLIHQLFPSL